MIIDTTEKTKPIKPAISCYSCGNKPAIELERSWHNGVLYIAYLCDDCLDLKGDWIGCAEENIVDYFRLLNFKVLAAGMKN